MNKEIWIKLFSSPFLIISAVILLTTCVREEDKQANMIQPQYNDTILSVTANNDSQQIAETSSARISAKEKNTSDDSNLSAGEMAASTDTRLDSRIDLSGITVGLPFGQAIEILRNSTYPPLNIVVFWNDLRDNALIDRDTPIGAEAISGVSLRKNLEILLASLPVKLDYTVIDGVIVIATKESLPKKMQRRTYDISDLPSRPADYHSGTD